MEIRAVLKKIRVSTRKLNLVATEIRGMSTKFALRYLEVCPKRIAKDVRKLLVSAIANAENNYGIDGYLYVKEAFVGQGLRLKRFVARGRSHANVLEKPFSRLTIKLSDGEDEVWGRR
ncbi:MAG: 50S ribosomal protein L22 [Holosporales bacterium]|jgi:large subunit ribosomal protein L22|nr:50S ribosomal protein L22 [Holosporales bacterium]